MDQDQKSQGRVWGSHREGCGMGSEVTEDGTELRITENGVDQGQRSQERV